MQKAQILNLNPAVGTVSREPIKPRLTAEGFDGMSSSNIRAAVKAAYPEYREDIAMAYLDGAALTTQMLGMPEEAIDQFLQGWALREEYMYVATLYSWARAAEIAFGNLVATQPQNIQ